MTKADPASPLRPTEKGSAARWLARLPRISEAEAQALAAEASRLRGRPVDIGPALDTLDAPAEPDIASEDGR